MLENKQFFLFLIFISIFLLCFSSCKMKAEQKSLTSQFETIDALINQSQLDLAVKSLKKIEKKAHDSWSNIAVFKRYILIGEKERADLLLKKALKKNSENLELLAVYSNFLIKENRFDEAENYAKKLCETKYSSIYSELILKTAINQKENDDNVTKNIFYNEQQFYQIYLDAYNSTKNPIWLKNCAVFDLTNGNFEKASLLNPNIYADADDAFFWAEILYDAKKYYASLEALKKSKDYLSDYQNKSRFMTSEVKIAALESDIYMALSDMEKSQKVRQNIIDEIENQHFTTEDEQFLPVIFVNSAIWEMNQGNSDSCADLLFYAVNKWPDYVPALVLYADYAYNSNLERKEDTEILALRNAGISSLEMERYDKRRKIPLSDALYRIDNTLAKKNDPYLEIVKLDLKYKTNKNYSEKEKNRDLWYLLEDVYESDKTYNYLLVQYALNYLLRTNQKVDAWKVFYDYVSQKNDFSEKRDFWEQFIEKINDIELSICEFAGYFATEYKLLEEAVRIYEYCVYESAGFLEEEMISPEVSTNTCMNLADIYFSIGKKDKALRLYGIISGRETKNSLRSDIFYRIANIYVAQGDIKNALRLAEYSYSLYPQSVRASVLKDKLHLYEINAQ